MRLLIKLPSRSRPSKLLSTIRSCIQMASDVDNIRMIVSLDIDDPTLTDEIKHELYSVSPHVFISIGTSTSKIDAINRDMPDPSQFDILLLMSDDMVPQVKGYDQIIRDIMRNNYPDTDGVLFFNDGHQGKNLNTIVICGSKYYKRFNYIYYPGYKSFYCDNEFMDNAYKLNRQVYIDKVIIRHEHPVINKNIVADALYIRNQQFLQEDYELYLKRQQINRSHVWTPPSSSVKTSKLLYRISTIK